MAGLCGVALDGAMQGVFVGHSRSGVGADEGVLEALAGGVGIRRSYVGCSD